MKYTLLLVLLHFALPALTQTKPRSFSVGISTGTSLSSFAGAKSPFAAMDYQPSVQAGLMAGILVEYAITRQLAIETGIYYEEKGVRVDAKRTGHTQYETYERQFVRKVDNDYLSLPILLRWQSTGKWYWSAGAGGFLAMLQSAKIYGMEREKITALNGPSGSIGGNFSSEGYADFRTNGKERTHKLDYGLALGTGIHYGLNSRLKLSLRTLLR